MPSNKKFYAVAVGRTIGIYNTWDECQKEVSGYPKARFKSFQTKEEALAFIEAGKNEEKQQLSNGNNKRERSTEITNNPYKNTSKKKRPILFDKQLKIHVTFDGGSRGNPGIGGAGATVTVLETIKPKSTAVEDANKNSQLFRRVIYVREYLGNNLTNNEAEYQGLIRGLKVAMTEATSYCPPPEILQTDLVIQGDSELIIKQLNGINQVRKDNLIVRYNEVQNLIRGIEKMGECKKTYEHMYRADNKIADGLANEAMDARRSWLTTSDDNHQTQRPL